MRYEFALLLDQALRRRGTRERATLTVITPEPYLGHLDSGIPAARRIVEQLFARRHITAITGAAIVRVDRQGVHLRDGRIVPAAYTLVMPPLSGVAGIATSPDLTDADGFVPVDARYRHMRHPRIYAAGVAAHLGTRSSPADRPPKTSHLALATAKAAARNVAAAITGSSTVARVLPRLLTLRLLDGATRGCCW